MGLRIELEDQSQYSSEHVIGCLKAQFQKLTNGSVVLLDWFKIQILIQTKQNNHEIKKLKLE